MKKNKTGTAMILKSVWRHFKGTCHNRQVSFLLNRKVLPWRGELSYSIKKPFKLNGMVWVDDTPIHAAIREAFINMMIHSGSVR